MNALVSVVVPIYNAQDYIAKCINSVLDQTYKNYELILINDGSIDNSGNIIEEYKSKYKDRKIQTLHKPNGGLSSTRNIAISLASGEYITFLDADDYIDKDYLRKLVEKADTENLDVVISGQYKVSIKGDILDTIKYRIKHGRCLSRRLNVSGKLYRTEYITSRDISFPEGKIYEDNSFNLQAMFLSNKIGFIEYEGYYQVIHEGSITAKPIDATKLPFDEWEMCAKKIKEAAVKGVDQELFSFTFISFLTYFLLVRNRKREYLNNYEGEKSEIGTKIISEFFQSIVNKYFFDFTTNKYTKLFLFRELPIKQKMGTRLFVHFCNKHKLEKLVQIINMI